jgi:hypothetical protein
MARKFMIFGVLHAAIEVHRYGTQKCDPTQWAERKLMDIGAEGGSPLSLVARVTSHRCL